MYLHVFGHMFIYLFIYFVYLLFLFFFLISGYLYIHLSTMGKNSKQSCSRIVLINTDGSFT